MNFNKPFNGADGQPLKDARTMAEQLAVTLFNLNTIGGKPIDGEQKYRAYRLCRMMTDSPEAVEMTSEDAAFTKQVAAEALLAGAYGQVADTIEGRQ